MLRVPFNLAAHVALIAAGYAHTRVEADYADVGDAENGPELVGGGEFDHYIDRDSYVVIGENGEAHFEHRDLVLEAYLEQQEG